MSDNKNVIFTRRMTAVIAGVVTTVWAVSFIADILLPNYEPSPLLHLIMMTVVGAAVGRGFINSQNRSDQND